MKLSSFMIQRGGYKEFIFIVFLDFFGNTFLTKFPYIKFRNASFKFIHNEVSTLNEKNHLLLNFMISLIKTIQELSFDI